MNQLRFFLAFAMLFVLSCSVGSSSDESSELMSNPAVSLHKDVPFKVTLGGGGTPPAPDPLCPGLLLTELTVQGTATHLGRFTGVQHHCLNPATGEFTSGNFDYTAANGDHLLGTYSGFLVPTPDPIIFEITGAFVLVSGTGRFEDAAGGGTPSGFVDVTTGDFVLDLDGSISF